MLDHAIAHEGVPEGSGGVWPEEGEILYNYALEHGGPVLEIGTWRGVSTRYIAMALRARDKDESVWTVDFAPQWSPGWDWCEVEQVIENSFNINLGMKFPWAFIDGDHHVDSVIKDIITAKRHGCKVAIFHDGKECPNAPGVRKGIKQFGYVPEELGGRSEMLKVDL